MKAKRWLIGSLVLLLPAAIVSAAEFTVEATDQKAPADALSEEIAGELSDQALTVKSGSRTHCEIWLCKEWRIQADFTASAELLYPFEVGQLLGVVRYERKGSDFSRSGDQQGHLYDSLRASTAGRKSHRHFRHARLFCCC